MTRLVGIHVTGFGLLSEVSPDRPNEIGCNWIEQAIVLALDVVLCRDLRSLADVTPVE
jgi:hypothetical protein